MKYQHLVSLALAAALLTGCGGTQSSPSAAADQSSDSSRSTPGAVAQAAQTDRITDQYTLEKNVSGVWGEEAVQYISVHVPQLECDSPDAASINEELNAIYAADFREFEAYEEAGQPDGDAPLIGVGWDDWWYGDCVSLVVRSRYGGTAPWRYSGWCFDFATGQQITVAEMLQRMGLDPDTVQAQVQRQAMQAFDREMAQGAYYEGLRLGGELSQMRMDTLKYNELENLCLLLPEQDQLMLRGKYSCEEGWQQLDMELSPPSADTPVLTDTYDGVQVQLEGTQAILDPSILPGNFDISRVRNLKGATQNADGTLTVQEGGGKVTYEYRCVGEIYKPFTLNVTETDDPNAGIVPPVTPPSGGDTPGGSTGGETGGGSTGGTTPGGSTGGGDGGGAVVIVAAVGAVAAGVVGYGVYNYVSGQKLQALLPEGVAAPENRAQTALLLWNTAGRPEPAEAPAFADVADPDTAKAAQWCVEQGLMKRRLNGKFAPGSSIPAYQVLNAYRKLAG